ncbi:hypothetical protein [Spongiactinospora sp. 9N601]|uniref:hypothetical protein n=1 Tax=Spongiactinospora sp. 9N601 TaxID=3375149 RepID=UPI00379B2BE4
MGQATDPVQGPHTFITYLEQAHIAAGRPTAQWLATKSPIPQTTVEFLISGRRKRLPDWTNQVEPLLIALRLWVERGKEDPDAVLGLMSGWKRAYNDAQGHRPPACPLPTPATSSAPAPGWPLSEVTDPFRFDLEVHRAIDTGDGQLPALPVYVPRLHDEVLGKVVAAAAKGHSGTAVLVGGSSTGKTRACWEALHLLRERPEPWRLWHPIDPTRPGAALAEVHDIAPYTVVWLNEAQFYLGPDKLGEQVAAGLRELLRDPGRGPVLVLATLWPQHWEALTAGPDAGQFDSHAQARLLLLNGHDIRVPDAFTRADLDVLAGHSARDRRLDEAAEHAADGQITQYLAGVPVLLARYAQASPATQALIWAAIDARRMGAGPHLPLALLAAAAPGYLTDTQWEQAGDGWLQQALDYATTPCNGIPGILIPVKTGTPRNQRTRRPRGAAGPAAPSRAGAASGPLYRLADYLDQHGRRHRAEQIPPIDFWTAAAAHAHPADLAELGHAAWTRGLYRDAAQLNKHATSHGDPNAAAALVLNLHALHPTDRRPAQHAARHAALDAPYRVAELLDRLREAGAEDQVRTLLAACNALPVSPRT